MKNLTRIIAILLGFSLIVIIFGLFNLEHINDFELKIFYVLLQSLLPIIGIAICTYCLERGDTNYLIRIIPIYLTIPIIISIITTFFGIDKGFLVELYKFFSYTQLEVIGLTLLLVVNPNNVITKYLIYASFCILLVATIYSLMVHYSSIQMSLDDMELTYLLTSSYSDNMRIYISLTIVQIILIPLIYITNYAFSDKIEIEASNIDYDTVKQEATTLANAQMNNIYNISQKNNEPDRSLSEKGMMNINNQLGQNSNVGTVTSQAKEVNVSGSSLDSLMPLSKGPVVNSTVNEEPKQAIEETPEVAEEKVVQTPTPNIDIQEQMRLNREQSNQNNINQ